jgi:hypothetical protein
MMYLVLSSIDLIVVVFLGSAMELALSLEKLTNEKLLNLHSVRHFYPSI